MSAPSEKMAIEVIHCQEYAQEIIRDKRRDIRRRLQNACGCLPKNSQASHQKAVARLEHPKRKFLGCMERVRTRPSAGTIGIQALVTTIGLPSVLIRR
jgi:hypothetical protein